MENEKDGLFEQRLKMLKMRYREGEVPKINNTEYEILKFCHERNMTEFIREEFRRNPILYDENGDIIENTKYTLNNCPDSFFGGDAALLVENRHND